MLTGQGEALLMGSSAGHAPELHWSRNEGGTSGRREELSAADAGPVLPYTTECV